MGHGASWGLARSLSTQTVRWGASRCRLADTRFVSHDCVDLDWGVQLLKGVHRRERGARVLRERRGHCPGVASPGREQLRRLPQAGETRQPRPPYPGEALLGTPPCLGMPPLPQAGDGPPSSEGCRGLGILTFTLTTNSIFGIYHWRRLSRTSLRRAFLIIQSLGSSTPRSFAGCRELLRSTGVTPARHDFLEWAGCLRPETLVVLENVPGMGLASTHCHASFLRLFPLQNKAFRSFSLLPLQ